MTPLSNFKKLCAAVALAIISAVAIAMPSPADVANAVRREDWARAESLLSEVLRERESPKAHYQLGQVYAHQFRHAEALAEFRKAKALDPSLSFASSPQLFEAVVGREEGLVEGKLDAGAVLSRDAEAESASHDIGGASAAAQSEGSNASAIWSTAIDAGEGGMRRTLWIIVWIIVLGMLSVALVALVGSFRKPAVDQSGLATALPEDLEALPRRLDAAEAICKGASYSTSSKDRILEAIEALRDDIQRAISQWRQGGLSDSDIQALVHRASRLETAAETGVVTRPSTPDNDEPRRPAPAVPSKWRPATQPAAPHSAVSSSETYRGSSGGDGGGFLTGMVVGSLLSGSPPARSEQRREEPSNWSVGGGGGGDGGGGLDFDGGGGSDW